MPIVPGRNASGTPIKRAAGGGGTCACCGAPSIEQCFAFDSGNYFWWSTGETRPAKTFSRDQRKTVRAKGVLPTNTFSNVNLLGTSPLDLVLTPKPSGTGVSYTVQPWETRPQYYKLTELKMSGNLPLLGGPLGPAGDASNVVASGKIKLGWVNKEVNTTAVVPFNSFYDVIPTVSYPGYDSISLTTAPYGVITKYNTFSPSAANRNGVLNWSNNYNYYLNDITGSAQPLTVSFSNTLDWSAGTISISYTSNTKTYASGSYRARPASPVLTLSGTTANTVHTTGSFTIEFEDTVTLAVLATRTVSFDYCRREMSGITETLSDLELPWTSPALVYKENINTGIGAMLNNALIPADIPFSTPVTPANISPQWDVFLHGAYSPRAKNRITITPNNPLATLQYITNGNITAGATNHNWDTTSVIFNKTYPGSKAVYASGTLNGNPVFGEFSDGNSFTTVDPISVPDAMGYTNVTILPGATFYWSVYGSLYGSTVATSSVSANWDVYGDYLECEYDDGGGLTTGYLYIEMQTTSGYTETFPDTVTPTIEFSLDYSTWSAPWSDPSVSFSVTKTDAADATVTAIYELVAEFEKPATSKWIFAPKVLSALVGVDAVINTASMTPSSQSRNANATAGTTNAFTFSYLTQTYGGFEISSGQRYILSTTPTLNITSNYSSSEVYGPEILLSSVNMPGDAWYCPNGTIVQGSYTTNASSTDLCVTTTNGYYVRLAAIINIYDVTVPVYPGLSNPRGQWDSYAVSGNQFTKVAATFNDTSLTTDLDNIGCNITINNPQSGNLTGTISFFDQGYAPGADHFVTLPPSVNFDLNNANDTVDVILDYYDAINGNIQARFVMYIDGYIGRTCGGTVGIHGGQGNNAITYIKYRAPVSNGNRFQLAIDPSAPAVDKFSEIAVGNTWTFFDLVGSKSAGLATNRWISSFTIPNPVTIPGPTASVTIENIP